MVLPVQNIRAQATKRYQFTERMMGTRFQITFYASNDSVAEAAARKAFRHTEKLNDILSDYEAKSNLNRLTIRSGNGTFVPVHPALFRVISKAQQVARQTGGAFDITAGPFTKLWRKIRKSPHPQLPSPEVLDSLRKLVDYRFIAADSARTAIALERPNMQLDLGGIAKGYAADEILRVLNDMEIHSVLVNAGGDIRAGDAPPDEIGWTVSLPVHNSKGQRIHLNLQLTNGAVATSGGLFQHVDIDGKSYSHIIDPHTGLGLDNQSRVTIVAPDGITADSYASAVSVLGAHRGRSFIADKPGVAMRIEYKDGDKGEIQITSSSSFTTFIADGH
ncbi:MAG TPA: FAD:protein FMN transferase [Fodinibius sp.]|nr:FAD:protein FMN transferase [Fodinibius sp.]